MTAPQDLPTPITRSQFAQYVRGEDGQPLTSVIQILEEQQQNVNENLPALVQEAQDTASAAQTTANQAESALQGSAFVLQAAAPSLPLSRTLTAGQGIALADGGAGGALTVKTTDIFSTLAADVSDVTAAFVASGLVATISAGGVWLIEALLTFQSAATTTGIGLAFTLPTGGVISGGYWHPGAAANAQQSAYNTTAGAVSANTGAVPVAAANLPIFGRWIVSGTSAAGNIQLLFRTGVAASAVTLKGLLSSLAVRKIG